MMNAHRITRTLGTAAGGLLAVGLGIGAALAATPGTASADSSTDPFSWIGGMDPGDLSVPAQTSALDLQVSIDGMDLFPTAGNTATATSGMGDIAIAIGNGAEANAGAGTAPMGPLSPGQFDSAVAIGSGSVADAGQGNHDVALAFDPFAAENFGGSAFAEDGNSDLAAVFAGDGGEAVAGLPGSSDLAAAFGDFVHAAANLGSNLVDIGSAFWHPVIGGR
jgi:hypothetical protein